MDDEDLLRVLDLYFSCCEQAGIEPLPFDEAWDKAQRFLEILGPAFEAAFRLH